MSVPSKSEAAASLRGAVSAQLQRLVAAASNSVPLGQRPVTPLALRATRAVEDMSLDEAMKCGSSGGGFCDYFYRFCFFSCVFLLLVGWLTGFGWLAGWSVLVGWLAGWWVGWLAGWLAGGLAGWLAVWLAGWLAGWLFGWWLGGLVAWLLGGLVALLLGCFVASFLTGCLAGWLLCFRLLRCFVALFLAARFCLAAWLLGCLAALGCLVAWLLGCFSRGSHLVRFFPHGCLALLPLKVGHHHWLPLVIGLIPMLFQYVCKAHVTDSQSHICP